MEERGRLVTTTREVSKPRVRTQTKKPARDKKERRKGKEGDVSLDRESTAIR